MNGADIRDLNSDDFSQRNECSGYINEPLHVLSDEEAPLEGEEGLEISGRQNDGVYPNADVRVSKDQYSLLHLKRLAEQRKELVINPDYQRLDVWQLRQKVELVESIIMGIPLPVIYLFESKDGKKQVVDGRQRITAIIDFLNDKFTLKDLRILPVYNDMKFSDLPPKIQGVFEDYQIFCYVIQPPTSERVKYDIFDRVNRGGTKLNSQEMRNALYRGTSTDLIDDICRSEEFLKVTDNSVSTKRMRDRYAVLRILSFYLWFSDQLGCDETGVPIDYKSDMDDFLAKVMVKINSSATKSDITLWHDRIISAFSEIYNVLGKDAFRFESAHGKKRPINMPLMEALTYLFTLPWKRFDIDLMRRKVSDLKVNLDYSEKFKSKVDSTISVKERFSLMRDFASDLNKITLLKYDKSN